MWLGQYRFLSLLGNESIAEAAEWLLGIMSGTCHILFASMSPIQRGTAKDKGRLVDNQFRGAGAHRHHRIANPLEKITIQWVIN